MTNSCIIFVNKEKNRKIIIMDENKIKFYTEDELNPHNPYLTTNEEYKNVNNNSKLPRYVKAHINEIVDKIKYLKYENIKKRATKHTDNKRGTTFCISNDDLDYIHAYCLDESLELPNELDFLSTWILNNIETLSMSVNGKHNSEQIFEINVKELNEIEDFISFFEKNTKDDVKIEIDDYLFGKNIILKNNGKINIIFKLHVISSPKKKNKPLNYKEYIKFMKKNY